MYTVRISTCSKRSTKSIINVSDKWLVLRKLHHKYSSNSGTYVYCTCIHEIRRFDSRGFFITVHTIIVMRKRQWRIIKTNRDAGSTRILYLLDLTLLFISWPCSLCAATVREWRLVESSVCLLQSRRPLPSFNICTRHARADAVDSILGVASTRERRLFLPSPLEVGRQFDSGE